MSDTETRDPEAIERDLDRTRARLDTRLSELASRLSPGQIVDETLGMLRTREGADFARNLGEAVREKPIPAALVGIGVAWLMAGPRDHRRPGETVRGPSDLMTRAWNVGRDLLRNPGETEVDYRARVAEVRGEVLGVRRNAQETVESYVDRIQEALFAGRDRLSDAVSSAGATIRDTAASAADTMHARAHDVRNAAADLGSSAAEQARQWMPDGRGLIDGASLGGLARALGDNPVLLGAMGMAAGALLGALMPVTEFEREHLGEATRAFRDAIAETARTATDRGADVARTAMDAGRETMREASQHVRDVANQAADAARDAAGEAQQNARSVADRAQQHAGAMRDKTTNAARDIAERPGQAPETG